MKNKKLLTEDKIETLLMVAGFIPVIGEVADIILIIRYCMKGEYLYAGLMLIALIPTVGDLIAKPFIKLLKSSGVGAKAALKGSEEFVTFLKANPKIAEKYVKVGSHLDNPLIQKTISQVEGISGRFGNELKTAIGSHKSVMSKIGGLFQKPAALGKTIGKEIAAGGKFSTGFKNFFRDEKLASYIAKKQMAPANWLSNWYNVVYKGYKARRQFVRNFIVANHLLDVFHLPSLDAFEEKFEHDANFRSQLAQNPQFSDLVNQTTSQNDVGQIESSLVKKAESGIGSFIGLGMLKIMAKKLVP